MPNRSFAPGQFIEDGLTRYLRATTTDDEIKSFYGDGNIVGRKGIPGDDRALLEATTAALDSSSRLRPELDREKFAVGGIDQMRGYDYSTADIPNALDPATGRPWQMTFGELPKDFGASSLTPAAQQFLSDFRIPRNAGSDYSFDTGPNIQDRIDYEIRQAKDDYDFEARRNPERAQARLDEATAKARSQSPHIGTYSGQPQTPRTWIERGYATDKPEDFKEKVLAEFRDRILKAQGSFGGVSTLTPVEQRKASNPAWRADLYEQSGLAGPQSSQSYSSGYGGGEQLVQRFTTGKDSLLPLQPYTEFLTRISGQTPPSAVGGEPPADFTPLQKKVGTRNYLIGRNILEGRGNLGAGFRAAASAADLSSLLPLFNQEFRQAVETGDTRKAGTEIAKEIITGATTSTTAALAAGVAQTLAPNATARVLPVLAGAAPVATPVLAVTQLGGDSRQSERQLRLERQQDPAALGAQGPSANPQLLRAEIARRQKGKWVIPGTKIRVPELGITEGGGLAVRDVSQLLDALFPSRGRSGGSQGRRRGAAPSR